MVKKKKTELRMLTGERIRFLRKRAGFSQLELAKRMGYTSRGTVSQIEGGQIGMSDDMIVKAAKILDVPPLVLTLPTKLSDERLLLLINIIKVLEVPDAENLDAIEVLVNNALAKI